MRQGISTPITYEGEYARSTHTDMTLLNASARLLSIDIVRGWAMVTMLLTHSANEISGVDYRSAFRWTDTLAVQMNTAQNWIGLVIGISAPAFFILLGVGMELFVGSRKKRQWTEWEISRFSLLRGFIFIALEQCLLNWQFSTLAYYPYVGVLTTMGIIVIILAVIRRFDIRIIALIGIVVLLLTQAYYYAGQPTDVNFVRSLFLAQSNSLAEPVDVAFPVLGWLPIVILGYVTGRMLAEKRINLRRFSLRMGSILIALFFVVRLVGGFGNLYEGHFLAFTKVPPSMVYLLFYSGVVYILLWMYTFYRSGSIEEVLVLFGQTALLFYVLHEEFILNLLGRIIDTLPYPPILLTFISTTIAGVILYVLCYRYRALRRKYPDSVLKYF